MAHSTEFFDVLCPIAQDFVMLNWPMGHSSGIRYALMGHSTKPITTAQSYTTIF
jgi:hypothetical protein